MALNCAMDENDAYPEIITIYMYVGTMKNINGDHSYKGSREKNAPVCA